MIALLNLRPRRRVPVATSWSTESGNRFAPGAPNAKTRGPERPTLDPGRSAAYSRDVRQPTTTRTVLRSLRTDRRRRHLADVHWTDTLYKTYLTIALAGAAVFYLSPLFGTDDA